MACEHKRIKSVNCRIFCDICGEELPIDYLVGKDHIAAQNAAKTAEKPAEKAAEPAKKTTRKKVQK